MIFGNPPSIFNSNIQISSQPDWSKDFKFWTKQRLKQFGAQWRNAYLAPPLASLFNTSLCDFHYSTFFMWFSLSNIFYVISLSNIFMWFHFPTFFMWFSLFTFFMWFSLFNTFLCDFHFSTFLWDFHFTTFLCDFFLSNWLTVLCGGTVYKIFR